MRETGLNAPSFVITSHPALEPWEPGPRRKGAHASHHRPKSSKLHKAPNKTKKTVSKGIYK